MSLDSHSSQSNDDNNHDDNYNDHNTGSADGLDPLALSGDDLNDLDIPFDGGEYSNSNQSPLAEPSNAGSYDQPEALDPANPQASNINRTYHPIINGGS
jgi:hypothetical protein